MRRIEYIDETITRLKKEKERKNNQKKIDLTKILMINQENYCFERKFIFDNKVSLFLPTYFVLMEEKVAKEKYPSIQRPNLILTNIDKSINFTFSLTTDEGYQLDILFLKKEVEQAIKKVTPSNLFYEEGLLENENRQVCYFDFKSFSLDGPIYNMMYIFLLNSQVVIGNFNCPFEYYEEWRPVLFKIIESIEIIK